MSHEILGEPPVVDYPVDGQQPELVELKVGDETVYPSFEEPTVLEIAHELQRKRSRKWAMGVLTFLGSVLLFGFFFGLAAGYAIWG